MFNGGDFGPVRLFGVMLGLLGTGGGVGDLPGSFVTGGADVALCGIAGLLDFGDGAGADLAYLLLGAGAQLGEFAFQVFHACDCLGGGVVGLLAVGAGVVAFGLGVPAALDF